MSDCVCAGPARMRNLWDRVISIKPPTIPACHSNVNENSTDSRTKRYLIGILSIFRQFRDILPFDGDLWTSLQELRHVVHESLTRYKNIVHGYFRGRGEGVIECSGEIWFWVLVMINGREVWLNPGGEWIRHCGRHMRLVRWRIASIYYSHGNP